MKHEVFFVIFFCAICRGRRVKKTSFSNTFSLTKAEKTVGSFCVQKKKNDAERNPISVRLRRFLANRFDEKSNKTHPPTHTHTKKEKQWKATFPPAPLASGGRLMNGICFRSVSNCFFVVVVVVAVAVAAEGSASWRSRIRARWTKCWRRRRTNSTARRSTPKLHSRAGRIPKWVPMRIIYFKQKKNTHPHTHTHTHTHQMNEPSRNTNTIARRSTEPVEWVERGSTGVRTWFDWVLLLVFGFYRVLLGLFGVLLDFTGFYWVNLSFTGFFWVFPRFFLGYTGFDWVCSFWVLLGLIGSF